jgi:hypothetical protein
VASRWNALRQQVTRQTPLDRRAVTSTGRALDSQPDRGGVVSGVFS